MRRRLWDIVKDIAEVEAMRETHPNPSQKTKKLIEMTSHQLAVELVEFMNDPACHGSLQYQRSVKAGAEGDKIMPKKKKKAKKPTVVKAKAKPAPVKRSKKQD